VVRATLDRPVAEVAARLGRSIAAVSARRVKLRDRDGR
jgi:hypothetical protein